MSNFRPQTSEETQARFAPEQEFIFNQTSGKKERISIFNPLGVAKIAESFLEPTTEIKEVEVKSMNYLNGKRVYLAGAISMDSTDGVSWREEITGRLTDFGIIVDDPCKTVISNGKGEVGADKAYFRQLIKERKFEQLKKEFYPVVRKDLRSVDLANFLIVGHDPEIPTVGTIHEIVIATHIEKKPVLLFCPEEKLDKLNPWMLTFLKKQWIFTNWNDMFNYLKEIDKGNLDTSHWVL